MVASEGLGFHPQAGNCVAFPDPAWDTRCDTCAFGCEQVPRLPRSRRQKLISALDGGLQGSGRACGVSGAPGAAFGSHRPRGSSQPEGAARVSCPVWSASCHWWLRKNQSWWGGQEWRGVGLSCVEGRGSGTLNWGAACWLPSCSGLSGLRLCICHLGPRLLPGRGVDSVL